MNDRLELVAERTVTALLTQFLIGVVGQLASEYEDPVGVTDAQVAIWREIIGSIREPFDADLLEGSGIQPDKAVVLAQARAVELTRLIRENVTAVIALGEAGAPN